MLWMCIVCMSPYHDTGAIVGQAFVSYIDFWFSPEGKTTRCRPIQVGSHINANLIQGVSHPSHAVDVHVYEY